MPTRKHFKMLSFHKNHKLLVVTSFAVYVGLSGLIAVAPALQMKDTQPLPQQQPLSDAELRGLKVFVKENCMACHTQQVRNIEMDKVWGDRPSMPSDYFFSKQRLSIWQQSASLLGSERTGPDLTNIGKRQPGREWHLLHFYNPRIVVKESVMPAYPWMFEEKADSEVRTGDVIVPLPDEFRKHDTQMVATDELLDLIAYVQSLKQAPVPGPVEAFIPSTAEKAEPLAPGAMPSAAEGKKLYMQNCSACHQESGKGLPGAFPPLAGSPIVNDSDPDLMTRIILQGYDARSEYAQMPGFASALSDEEIAAIMSHERASWGNDAAPISAGQVKEIRESVMKELNP
jgi:cytochrome c oxidase cbb3-type subunit 2